MLLAITLAAAQATPAAPPPVPAPAVTAPASIDPERKALAQQSVAFILRPGSYGRMMSQLMGDAMLGAVFDLTPEQLGVPGEGGKAKSETLRDAARKSDPLFEERMRLTMKAMGEEMARISTVFEPSLREGLTLAMAKRFTAPQLRDLNAFFATESGRIYADQSLMMWTDPELMKSMMKALPALMAEMPAMMKKVEAATAHLPPPPKPKGKEKIKGSGD